MQVRPQLEVVPRQGVPTAQQGSRCRHSELAAFVTLSSTNLLQVRPRLEVAPQQGVPGAREGTEEQLQLVLLDFGLAEELPPAVRHHFISLLNMIAKGAPLPLTLLTIHSALLAWPKGSPLRCPVSLPCSPCHLRVGTHVHPVRSLLSPAHTPP